MGLQFNTQQQNAIKLFRAQNQISTNISDEKVFEIMERSGKLPSCFTSLAMLKTSKQSSSGTITQNKGSIFGNISQKQQKELSELGFISNKGAGEKIKSSKGNTFVIVGEANNGRKIVRDTKGELQVLSNDNVLLKKSYVINSNLKSIIKKSPKAAQNVTIGVLDSQVSSAEKAFKQQLAEDGWAGDFADGISVLWGSDNRASKVQKDLDTQNKNIEELKNAANKGQKEFKAKFKEIFGIDYNQSAIADYALNPNEKNYKKAFGDKNNIQKRVADYNESQQTGASAVKGTATVAAGLTIGIATGGASIAALGIAAVGTAASTAAINASDRLSSDKGLKEGELSEIIKNAAWDGVSVIPGAAVGKVASIAIKGATMGAKIGRAATNIVGDTAMGTIQEYVKTGDISLGEVATNAALGAVGGAVVDGTLKSVKNKIKTKINTNKDIQYEQLYNEVGEPIAGGLFGKKSIFGSNSNKSKGVLSEKEIEKIVKNGKNARKANDPGTASSSRKLNQALDPTNTAVKDAGENANINYISYYAKRGEVCSVGYGPKQKLYVNDNGKAVELKISKEKFEELFPKTGFALTEQKGLNNCWLLSRLNSMTESSTGRAKIYSMLEELPNGDIQVKLNNSEPITFPGGKPAEIEAAKLGDGASPGLEMIHQAVLIKTLKGAEGDISDISQLNLQSLQEATGKMNSDNIATKYLLDSDTKFKHVTAPLRSSPELQAKYESDLEEVLTNFKNYEDMGTATWASHARSLVAYNPQTRMVTYHDPYYGGVDMTCTLDEFKRLNPYIRIATAPTKATRANTTPNTSNVKNDTSLSQQPQQTQTAAQQTPNSKVPDANSNVIENSYTEISKTTETNQTTKQPPNKTSLPIPDGYKPYKTIMGKLAIIDPKTNIVMYESKGTWKRLN